MDAKPKSTASKAAPVKAERASPSRTAEKSTPAKKPVAIKKSVKKAGRVRQTLSVLKILIRKIKTDDCFGMAAEIAYSLLLSLFPALLLLVSLLSLLQSPKAIILLSDIIGETLPAGVYEPIDKTIESLVAERHGGIFTASLLLAVWSSAAVFTSIMKAMERIYSTNLRYGYFKKQWIALQLVCIVSVALFVVFNLLLFGVQLERVLEVKYKLRWLKSMVQVFRYPVAFAVMVFSMVLVYKFSLRVGQKLSQILPGAVFMAVVWIVLCIFFGDYVKRQEFNEAYGVLGKAIAVLVWLYANALIFLVGAEINSLFYGRILRFKKGRLQQVIGEHKVREKNLVEVLVKPAP